MSVLGIETVDPPVAIEEDEEAVSAPPAAPGPADPPTPAAHVALQKPILGWTIKVVGVDCRNGQWSCTKPSQHVGKCKGVCVPGKQCTTIYPHNEKETHPWLTLRVSGPNGMVHFKAADISIFLGLRAGVPSITAQGLAVVNAIPPESAAVLMELNNFIFGDASPMSRLWLSFVSSSNTEDGPRSGIVRCLNERLVDNDPESSLHLLKKFAGECNAIPWPFPGFT